MTQKMEYILFHFLYGLRKFVNISNLNYHTACLVTFLKNEFWQSLYHLPEHHICFLYRNTILYV